MLYNAVSVSVIRIYTPNCPPPHPSRASQSPELSSLCYRAASHIDFTHSSTCIWSFPLYCYGMPSHLKAVLDRTIPLVRMKMTRQPDGTVRHEALADFSKIHTRVICGCGFPHWEGNFDGLKTMCRTCFGDPDIVCVPEAPLLNVPEAAAVADPLLERFQRAGEEYAAALRLSEETVAELEKPMIPAEEYIRNVNGI